MVADLEKHPFNKKSHRYFMKIYGVVQKIFQLKGIGSGLLGSGVFLSHKGIKSFHTIE